MNFKFMKVYISHCAHAFSYILLVYPTPHAVHHTQSQAGSQLLQCKTGFEVPCVIYYIVYPNPRGYRHSPTAPILKGINYCQDCLCSPCVVVLPPDFLRGSASPHDANAGKRHELYRQFWKLLRDLGVWRDEEYLARKEQRTVRDDRRDILPNCIIQVIIVEKF